VRPDGVACYKVMTRWNAPHQGRETAWFKLAENDKLTVNSIIHMAGGETVRYTLIFKRAQQ
jgi:hypothetical protein